ncbi:MAG: methionyl-tRNA formyltransferase [Calditrichia bacterium]
MKIVFMGTPSFAVTSMQKILESEHEIVGVVTVPDKPQGRGKKLLPSPVKLAAQEANLCPILQPEKLKDTAFIEQLKALNADLFVVVAFRILPPEVFQIPPMGTINLHASLLPEYKGAAPINWVLFNGEKKTGVTTFLINEGVDTGKILLQQEVEITEDETAGSLHDKLAVLGAKLLVETLDKLEANEITPLAQPEGNYKKAPKLTKEIQIIDWSLPGQIIKQRIHGLSPVPGAITTFRGKRVKIYRVELISEDVSNDKRASGVIHSVSPDVLIVSTGDLSYISIKEIQFEGKKKMSIEEAIRGYRFEPGEQFG